MGGLFRKRDYFVVLMIAITTYISVLDYPTLKYSIEPAWYIDQRGKDADGRHRNFADEVPLIIDMKNESFSYQLVPPIITDLDGDGFNEVITISKDMHLKVQLFY
jgi:hypothetical protein